MANEKHLEILRQGVERWNRWREEHPSVLPDLSEANLKGMSLHRINLSKANLRSANLTQADLSEANLHQAGIIEAQLYSANLSKANLNEARLTFSTLLMADLSGANLKDAQLSEASLSEVNLSGANLSGAKLGRVNLSGASLAQADLSDAYLGGAKLMNADFSAANLSRASLSHSQVLRSNFTGAILTGACIADWQIGSTTILDGVVCEYIFRTSGGQAFGEFMDRLPVDPNSTFAPGEFTQRFQILASAQATIDITFTEGIDWQAFFTSFQELRSQHPNQHIAFQGMEEKGNAFIVRLKVETEETGAELENLKGEIETAQKALYDNQLLLMKAQGQVEVYQGMMEVVKTLAARPMAEVTQNFHGPVGNVAGTNTGTMTAYINQNSDDINRLLAALRETAQQFPEEQKDEVLMELEDLEADLKAFEKQEPKRIGKRLQRLIAAGTAAATLAGGAATFSGNINDFTSNVLELAERVGLSQDAVQPN